METHGRTVLITAPFKGDAATLQKVLGGRYQTQVFSDVSALSQCVGPTTAVILLTEEALITGASNLGAALALQPHWSDIPIILLASHHSRAGRDNDAARRRLPSNTANVVVLERPMSSSSLQSAIAAAWQSRERQFEMRDRMAELAEERERFRILLENIPVGVCFVDLKGAALVSNPLYDHYFPNGFSSPHLGTESWFSEEADGTQLRPEMFPGARALRGDFVEGLVFRHRTLEGVDSWVRMSAVPLRHTSNEIIGAALVIVDIDDQKRAESTLRQFNELLEIQVANRTEALATALERLQSESNERAVAEEKLRHSLKMEAVGQLTGGIAHDFNNMLTGVLSALELIKIRLAKANISGVERYIDAAQVSAQRAASLTQRLLAFSRRQSLDTKAFGINDLVLSLHDLLVRSVNEQIKINLDLADSAPWVHSDSNQLENALLNLVINARDAMPNGGTITVSTRSETILEEIDEPEALTPGEYIRVEVRDTGTGIPPAFLSKVVEPFFTTKPQGQGTGLGLSMVYGFAKQSRGRMAIDSVPNVGTTVSIYLPAIDSNESGEVINEAHASPGAGQLLLLVEDDESVRMLNSEVLVALGYEVLIASDAQQALDIIEPLARLDLLVTDVGLPGMNGRQLAEIAQQRWPRLPVLFLTGYAQNAANREKFLGPHMELLTKPFPLQVLADLVSKMLDPTYSSNPSLTLDSPETN